MKFSLVCSLAALIISGGAQAKTGFEAAFDKALNYKCGDGYYINSTGAEEIATGVDAGKYDLNDVLNTYYRTCQFERSKRVAGDVKRGRSDIDAFNKVLNYKCTNGYYINSDGAEEVAGHIAAGKYTLNDVLNTYFRTCEFERSKRVAADVKRGRSDLDAFNRTHSYKCKNGYYLNSTGAEEVAGAVGSGYMQLADFLNIYYATCEFERSKRIATDGKKGKLDLAAFSKALNYKCKNGYYLNSDGAEEVAYDVGVGKMQLDTFLNMYYSTCEYTRSVRMAKASKNSGNSGNSGGVPGDSQNSNPSDTESAL